MQIRHQVLASDAADLERERAFWAGVLGDEVRGEGGAVAAFRPGPIAELWGSAAAPAR